jgi:hypothetical protein
LVTVNSRIAVMTGFLGLNSQETAISRGN